MEDLVIWLYACAPTTTTTTPAPTDSEPPPTEAGVALSLVDGYGTLIRAAWTQDAPGTVAVEYRVGGGGWSTTPARAAEAGPLEQLVIGVPYGSEVEVRVVADRVAGASATIDTAPWPERLPVPTVLAQDPTRWDATAPYWVTSASGVGEGTGGRWWAFILNRDGEIVWAEESTTAWVTRHVSVAPEGRALLLDRNTYYAVFDGGAGSTVVRQTLDGGVQHVYATPGLHHTFVGLPDRIVWPAKRADAPEIETLEEVDEAGVQGRIWSCEDFHGSIGVDDTCGSNGLFWRADVDRFLMSFWSTESVVEIDPLTGASVRWFGTLPGSYVFDPPESQFWWPHGPTWTADGTLLISTKDEDLGQETLVREYAVDEVSGALREVWSFGQGRGVFGTHMGEALRLPSGNTYHGYGSAGHLVEVTSDGTVVWEVDWEYGIGLGHATPVADLYALVP